MDDLIALRRLAGILNENMFDPTVAPALDDVVVDEMTIDEAPVVLDEYAMETTADPVLKGLESRLYDVMEQIEKHLLERAEHEAQELSRSMPEATVIVSGRNGANGQPGHFELSVDGDTTSHSIAVAKDIHRLDYALLGECTPIFSVTFKGGKLIAKS